MKPARGGSALSKQVRADAGCTLWSAFKLVTDGGRKMEVPVATQTAAVVPRAPRVLVVDDDPAIRTLCSVNLQAEGLHVLEATDGRRALARARREKPDLVLTDVKMPGLDGFQLAEALRRDKHTSQIPFIFLSGETTAASEARAYELGALAYVTKPFDPLALASLVAGVLAHAA
jgi:CheY-like chemotaxis protein